MSKSSNSFSYYLLRRLLEDKDALIFPIALLGLGVTMAVGFRGYLSSSTEVANKKPSEMMLIAITGMVTVSAMVFMIRFLSGTSDRSRNREPSYEFHRLQREVLAMKRSVGSVGDLDRDAIVQQLVQQVRTDGTDLVMSEMRERLKEQDFRNTVSDRAKDTLQRIYREIDALGRRGTLNLVLGVVMAIGGITLLAVTVLRAVSAPSTLQEFSILFLPRLTIVSLIELFSYFFLRLYKSSLDEIKYFQNEATNVEFHFAALEASIHFGKEELIASAIAAFLGTDRNPLLHDGLTTRELASQKQFDSLLRLSPEYLIEVVKAVRGGVISEKG